MICTYFFVLYRSPSTAFLQFVQQNLNVTAIERGFKQFDQFINEMLEIVQKNLSHMINELLFRMEELRGYSIWMERFACLGLNTKKINTFIEKLSGLHIKLDQLQLLITDTKLNLTAFKDYLMFLSSTHNNEDSELLQGFDKYNNPYLLFSTSNDLEIHGAIPDKIGFHDRSISFKK